MANVITRKGEIVQDPPLVHKLLTDPRAGWLWLPLRLWLGYQWFEAATHKVFDPKWVQTGDGHDPDQRPLCAPHLALAAFAQLLAFAHPFTPSAGARQITKDRLLQLRFAQGACFRDSPRLVVC